jgi:hypothetical protein
VFTENHILFQGLRLVGFPGERPHVHLALKYSQIPSSLWCESFGGLPFGEGFGEQSWIIFCAL